MRVIDGFVFAIFSEFIKYRKIKQKVGKVVRGIFRGHVRDNYIHLCNYNYVAAIQEGESLFFTDSGKSSIFTFPSLNVQQS